MSRTWKYLNDEKFYKIYPTGGIIFDPISYPVATTYNYKNGSVEVSLCVKGEHKKMLLGELIYETFNGRIKKKNFKLVYVDGNVFNNKLENLTLAYKKFVVIKETEVCKYTKDYKGWYSVDINANIKSLTMKNAILKTEEKKLLEGTINYVYMINNLGERKYNRVDKIVYETFKEKLKDGEIIQHIDGNTLNDKLINLKAFKPIIMPDFDINKVNDWMPIIGYELKYHGSKFGEVKNIKTGNMLKPSNCKYEGMYKHIKLTDDNGVVSEFRLHRVIYEAFLGKKISDDLVVDHIDNDKNNTNIDNLRAITQSQNVMNRIVPKPKRNKDIIQDENFVNIGTKIDTYDFSNYSCNNHGQIKNKNAKLITGHVDKGYKLYGLVDKITNKVITIRAHRAVACVFLPNPNKYEVVHHKDNNRTNNYVTNLEWTTQQQNTLYSVGRKINQYTKDGKFIKSYDSIGEAMTDNGYKSNHISSVCNGERPYAEGYKWKWA